MLAQKITFNLMQNKLDDIRVVQGDSCREILFEGSDLDGVLSYDDYTYEFDLMKSDGTFVIQTLSAGVLIPTEQMEVITGTHYYSVKVKDADNELVYSGQGAFIVDDNVITEDAIESVAEVNGLVFPDDFLTDEDEFAQIDDTVTSSSSVWSSLKTNTAIEEAISSIPSPTKEYTTIPKIIGTWINGKNVYEYVKAVSISIPANGGTVDVSLNEVPSDASILSVSAINSSVGWGSGGLNQCVPCYCMQWNGYPNVGVAQFSPWSFSCTHLIIQYIDN